MALNHLPEKSQEWKPSNEFVKTETGYARSNKDEVLILLDGKCDKLSVLNFNFSLLEDHTDHIEESLICIVRKFESICPEWEVLSIDLHTEGKPHIHILAKSELEYSEASKACKNREMNEFLFELCETKEESVW